MRIFSSDQPLTWGKLDLPIFGVSTDWHGNKLNPAIGFSLACDGKNLWFIATRQAENSILPGSAPSRFTPELWKYDVSELFLGNPRTGEYLEFNIAANGSWWASKFTAPRIPATTQPDFESHISAFYDDGIQPTWLAALAIPIEFLEQEISFGSDTTGNVTFIQNSPEQMFLSAVKLPGTEPDFHQPTSFTPLQILKTPSI